MSTGLPRAVCARRGSTCRSRGHRASAPRESPLSHLFGSGEPFDAATLSRLYPGGAADYLERFTESLDEAIRSGFLLAADRQEILDLAAGDLPSPLAP